MSQEQELLSHIEKLKQDIAVTEALQRMQRTPEFKLVIEEMYLLRYASQLVHNRSDPSKQSALDQTLNTKAIDGVGSFSNYLSTLEAKGRSASQGIKEAEHALTQLRVSDLDN